MKTRAPMHACYFHTAHQVTEGAASLPVLIHNGTERPERGLTLFLSRQHRCRSVPPHFGGEVPTISRCQSGALFLTPARFRRNIMIFSAVHCRGANAAKPSDSPLGQRDDCSRSILQSRRAIRRLSKRRASNRAAPLARHRGSQKAS